MKPKALVTLATNDFLQIWKNVCLENWQEWAYRNNYEIHIFNKPLDKTLRAQSRSHAWQKLLAMTHEKILDYSYAFWLDADILINSSSPDPITNLDQNKIAVTVETGSKFSDDNSFIKRAREETFKVNNISSNYYEGWGFDGSKRPLFNSGVIGFNPKLHKRFLLDIYHKWEDGGEVMLYNKKLGSIHEMIPFNLSVQNYSWQLINSKYNQLVFPIHNASNLTSPEKTCHYLNVKPCNNVDDLIVELFRKSYFLHFAGVKEYMIHIAEKIKKI